MKDVLRGWFGSKKAAMTIFAVVAALIAKAGWNVDAETLAVFLLPVITYVLGQGVADFGKEAAKETSKAIEIKPINGGP